MVAIVLLGLALLGALAVVAVLFARLDGAEARLDEQERQIQEQRELIDKKETFGAAMTDLLGAVAPLDGMLLGSAVPFGSFERLAVSAWEHRWQPDLLQLDTETARGLVAEMYALSADAAEQAMSNTTGSRSEAVIDDLGGGFVASAIDDADSVCKADVLACVASDDPYVIHFDAQADSLPYMTDWLRTGIAYHEFAHVLQFTNPEQTEPALLAFGGNSEIMADCFALTYLDGWTLEHRIWEGSRAYWDVSVGYGVTCDETQKQTVRQWREGLGVRVRPISQ